MSHTASQFEVSASACVSQSGGDAVDGGGEGVIQIRVLITRSFAAHEGDLNQAHRINVRIAKSNRAGEDQIVAQKLALARQLKNHLVRQPELFFDHLKDALA